LGYSTEQATHIVVVNREGSVLESWRGDLKVGATLPFPAPEKRIDVNYDLDYPVETPGQERVKSISGNRRVLFLIRAKNGDTWNPANINQPDFDLATVWIEEGQSFAIYQIQNSGPKSDMHPLFLSETELKTQTANRTTRLPKDGTKLTKPKPATKRELDLSGSWRLMLPAGYEHEITLKQTHDGIYRLASTGLNFNGDYCLEEGQLLGVGIEDRKAQYLWKVNSPYLLTLTKQTANVGSDYTGAVLFRPREQPARKDTTK
jgi:hypothetical protein